jgi:glyoxylase-like metal-dependent hydrolase (beta-lactamase superfamily II)
MKIDQLAVGGLDSNFSYLIHDEGSGDAALVDPCGDIRLIKSAVGGLRGGHPRYILLTHGHRDHCSGVPEVREFFNAPVAAHPACPFGHDVDLKDRQQLPFGTIYIECLYAPGHSVDSVIYHLSDDSALFTGDTLFIDWCGYCDPRTMFHTMREILYPLAGGNEVYPGHDYGRYPHASLEREKNENPYLYTSAYDQFCEELKKL